MKHTKDYMDAMWVVENPEKYDNRDVAIANSFIEAYNEGYNKALSLGAVVKSLPTDECVEQWWAEGKDQQKGFWQEAPYRTNGDVVEEIKTALKYFITVWQ